MGITLSPLQYFHQMNHSNFQRRQLSAAAPLPGHIMPLSLSNSWTAQRQWTASRGCRCSLAGFILFCLRAAELSWMPTLWGRSFSWDFVLTCGITYWEDFNGFLTPIVACENSILQTHCCIYLHVHTFLWFREGTQKRLSLYLPPPSLHTCFSLCGKNIDWSQLVVEHMTERILTA